MAATCPRCLQPLRPVDECICEPDDDTPEPWREVRFQSPGPDAAA